MRKTILLSLLAATVATSPALAETVVMSQPAEGAQELPILAAFFGERDTAEMKTAIIDINSDGVPELFARYEGPEDCPTEGVCRTVGLRFVGNDWKVVLDTRAAEIELGSPGFGGIRNVIADGITWSWKSSGYAIDVTTSGDPVSFSPAPAESAELLVYQFGEGALQLFQADQRITIEIGAVELSQGRTQVVARLGGPGVCGRVMGCPIRVLEVAEGEYRVLMEGFSSGDVIVSASDREGWKDLVAGMPASGHAVYGWDGERYGVAEMNIGK